MTYQELLAQLGQSSGSGDLYNELDSYGGTYPNFWENNEDTQAAYAANMFNLLGGSSESDGYSPGDPEFGTNPGGMLPPSGIDSWADMFQMLNPVTGKQLLGAKYNAMRPQIAKGMSSLQVELLNNLSKVRTGGFESSGFADKQRTQARDIYGKKASDILVSEGTKRQDYMSSLIDQVMADRDLMSSWIDYEG
tara:strand:- start:10323 stop:10901 length:579 start_codon:yes stop_codon:yes gene_type:complete